MAQQHRLQLQSGSQPGRHGIGSCTRQVSNRLIPRVGHHDTDEVAAPGFLGQQQGVAPVGFDPFVGRAAVNVRGRDEAS
jgi:hypothetical protein